MVVPAESRYGWDPCFQAREEIIFTCPSALWGAAKSPRWVFFLEPMALSFNKPQDWKNLVSFCCLSRQGWSLNSWWEFGGSWLWVEVRDFSQDICRKDWTMPCPACGDWLCRFPHGGQMGRQHHTCFTEIPRGERHRLQRQTDLGLSWLYQLTVHNNDFVFHCVYYV